MSLSAANAFAAESNQPKVYLLVEIEIIDKDLYGQYMEKVPAVIKKYGGRYLVRGGNAVPLVGNWMPQRIILIEFAGIEQLKQCFGSPEYLELAPLREQSTKARAVILEGIENLFLEKPEIQNKS